ncbi:heterocyst differentiation control protein [filamentous cyanobacterium CCP5]|nr:heterocyst differentiation control protein [filamentous cyanobacterium CCP5]
MHVEHFQLAKELKVEKIDLLLLQLANHAIKEFGHRYGSFLDAASTAAKFAIYISFLENGRNFRKTGVAHHVEPKRVREIVKEIEHAIRENTSLKGLSSKEPDYLIGIPHLWKEKYPWKPGTSRISGRSLDSLEEKQLTLHIPKHFPKVLLIDEGELNSLIEEMRLLSADNNSSKNSNTCSEALLEHIRYRLRHSETIVQVTLPFMELPLYALASNSYAPKGQCERLENMVDDTTRFIFLLKQWVQEEAYAFRALETLTLSPSIREQAFQELDEMLRQWGDKYHCDGGEPIILQMALGKCDEDIL